MKEKIYNINADIIRIFAGFGVVYIHVSDPFVVFPSYVSIRGMFYELVFLTNTFFKISVPLFIILSGYLLLKPSKAIDIKTFYKKRLSRVGIPLIFWMIVFFVWLDFIGETVNLYVIMERIISVNLEHLYFFFVILELYYITPFILVFLLHSKKVGHRYLVASAVAFTFLLTATNYAYPNVALNLQLHVLTIFIPFAMYYLIGFYLRKYNITFKWPIVAGFMFVLVTILTWFFADGNFDSYFRHYGGPTMMFMIISFFILLMQNSYIRKLANIKIVKRVVTTVASTIFGVYLVHMLIINIMKLNGFWIPGSTSNPIWAYVFIKTVIVFIICFVVTFIGLKIPIVKKVFGG